MLQGVDRWPTEHGGGTTIISSDPPPDLAEGPGAYFVAYKGE